MAESPCASGYQVSMMRPSKPIPYSGDFSSADEYVDALLQYVTTTPIFQTLCGGVHIMDFYTTDPGLFYSVVPADWQPFLLDQEPMELLDFLLRDDMEAVDGEVKCGNGRVPLPASLIQYVRDVRRFSLRREFGEISRKGDSDPSRPPPPPLARKITTGMSVKKVHEVTHFSDFVSRLADSVSGVDQRDKDDGHNQPVTHLVDVGSGQNYLGRALASPPYCRRVVAVESKSLNIAGAKGLDVLTGVATPVQKPMRNKKLYQQLLHQQLPPEKQSEKVRNRLARMALQTDSNTEAAAVVAAELRPRNELLAQGDIIYKSSGNSGDGKIKDVGEDDSPILYVEGRLENGDLSKVLAQVPPLRLQAGQEIKENKESKESKESEESEDGGAELAEVKTISPGFLAVSIHSCGNLSHYGLRALVLNPAVRAVAIVGCCYNLLTEKLGPPTFKVPGMARSNGQRPTLQPVNGRVMRESERRDPEGFPMSTKLTTYGEETRADERGIRFNITARMMACQAPHNWTESESEGFFTRHFYRAVLQRIFLDRGVLERVRWDGGADQTGEEGDAPTAVSPIIVGSLRKACYSSLSAYVRGAVAKIAAQGNGNGDASDAQNTAVNAAVAAKMADLTDAELDAYSATYGARKRELSAVWSLMAFSASVVESTIVTDRWLYLREQVDVAECWVQTVFAYRQSPRNLVVVGIKK